MIIPVFAAPRRIAFLIWCGSCLAALLHSGCAHSEKRTDTPARTASPTASQTATNNEPLRFVVSFPPGVRSKPATGRALLFLTRQGGGEPRTSGMFGIDQTVYARNITNWNPGAPLVFEPGQFRAPDALAYPARSTPSSRAVIAPRLCSISTRRAATSTPAPGTFTARWFPARCAAPGAVTWNW